MVIHDPAAFKIRKESAAEARRRRNGCNPKKIRRKNYPHRARCSTRVLGVWAVIGMMLAPVVLRRMARRQSGSAVAAARQRIMAKDY
jgi:hypothetical protein